MKTILLTMLFALSSGAMDMPFSYFVMVKNNTSSHVNFFVVDKFSKVENIVSVPGDSCALLGTVANVHALSFAGTSTMSRRFTITAAELAANTRAAHDVEIILDAGYLSWVVNVRAKAREKNIDTDVGLFELIPDDKDDEESEPILKDLDSFLLEDGFLDDIDLVIAQTTAEKNTVPFDKQLRRSKKSLQHVEAPQQQQPRVLPSGAVFSVGGK